MAQTQHLTLVQFIRLCNKNQVKIGDTKFEWATPWKARMEANLKIEGTFLDIAQKLENFLNEMKPFLNDEHEAKWLSVTGSCLCFDKQDEHYGENWLCLEFGCKSGELTLDGEAS